MLSHKGRAGRSLHRSTNEILDPGAGKVGGKMENQSCPDSGLETEHGLGKALPTSCALSTSVDGSPGDAGRSAELSQDIDNTYVSGKVRASASPNLAPGFVAEMSQEDQKRPRPLR